MGDDEPSAAGLEAIRSGLRESTDPRVARTRASILDAVDALLAEAPTSPLTTMEIIERSGVSRTSFYSHFSNLAQLGREVFVSAFSESGAPAPVPRFTVSALVDHYAKNARLYRSVLAGTFAAAEATTVVQAVADQIARVRAAQPGVSGEDHRSTDIFLASGLVGALDAWLRGAFGGDRAEVVARLEELTPTWLARSDGDGSGAS